MSEQNWIITLKKQSHLDDKQILTPQWALATVLIDLLETYDEYTAQDSITIRPTDMKYHE